MENTLLGYFQTKIIVTLPKKGTKKNVDDEKLMNTCPGFDADTY